MQVNKIDFKRKGGTNCDTLYSQMMWMMMDDRDTGEMVEMVVKKEKIFP